MQSRRGYLFVALAALALLIVAATVNAEPIAGNRGGCAEGNKWRRLACTITDFRPGYVSGTCTAGLWFRDVRTARTWVIDTPVTVRGCQYANDEIASAPDWTIRISK
jgi:hypothetical protein